MRPILIALFALLLIPFAGCGDDKAGGNGADGSGDTLQPAQAPKPAADPAPEAQPTTPTATDGAASPEALIADLKAAMDDDDMAGMVPLVAREQRGVLALALGMLAPAMMIGMGEGMAEMAGGGDPEKVKEAKAKFAKMKEGYEAILTKHGLDKDMSGAMGQIQGLQQDPDAAIEAANEMFDGVDHEAFIRDSLAFMKAQDDGSGGGMKMGPTKDDVKLEDVSIEVKGDTAVATAEGQDDPLRMVKRDGRWYLDFKSMMPGR